MNIVQYKAMAPVEDVHFWFVGKRAYIKVLLDQFRLGGRILDVGCGTGATTKFLTRYGEVVGIDLSSIAVRLARKHAVMAHRGSANALPFPARRFDVVTVFDVLYHQKIDVAKTLSEAYRVLKPRGMFLVTDCVHPRLWSAHDEAMGARERFTKRGLEAAIAAAGFRVRRSSYMFASVFPLFVFSRIFMHWRKPITFVTMPPKVINDLLLAVIRLEAALFTKVDLLFGSSVIIIAEKT